MTGTTLHFDLRDQLLSRELRDLGRRLRDPAPLLKSIGEEMLPRINNRFQKEQDPDGAKWPGLSPRTVEARLKRYGNSPLSILRMRGHLAGSINYQTGSTSLRIGTGTEVQAYAGIHQFGGMAGRGRKVKIPARPYLGFSDEDMDVIEEEALAFLDL